VLLFRTAATKEHWTTVFSETNKSTGTTRNQLKKKTLLKKIK